MSQPEEVKVRLKVCTRNTCAGQGVRLVRGGVVEGDPQYRNWVCPNCDTLYHIDARVVQAPLTEE